MFHQFLWALVTASAIHTRAQTATTPTLPLNSPVTLSGKNFSTTSSPVLFSLPSSSSQVTISLALCAVASSSPPLVFVSNSSDSQVVPGPNGGPDVYGVQIGSLGLGNFTLEPSSGSTAGLLAIYGGTSSDSLEIGVTQGTTPLHATVPDLPFFGDSTANEALLFSPPFLPPSPASQPAYPNYTLPGANVSLPSAPSSQNSPNFTLFLAPLSVGLTTLPQTACAVRAGVTNNTQAAQSAKVVAEQPWLRDDLGWRTEWLVGQLTALTNYSVYAIQDGTRLSGPIYFTTKSASFSCSLVHALPYCPTTAYSVPLPAPPSPALAYDASNMPDNLTTPLISYLTNFTTSLLTAACGRDAYSPLQTCADCQAAYRRWLCTVSLPRCGEFPQPPDLQQQPQSPSPPQQTMAVPLAALALQASSMTPRNAALGNVSYTALLPCIETCNAADRACPIFLGFRCPLIKYSASASYGVGYIDSADGEAKDGGVPGIPQDRWGNVFCNIS